MTSEIFFRKLQHHFEQQKPFVCKSQNHNLKAYLQLDNELVEVENFKASGFVFCPFTLPTKKVIFPASKTDILESELLKDSVEFKHNPIEESQESKIRHIELVDKAINYIKTGLAEKIVCSRKIRISKQIDPLQTFKKLAQVYPDAYVYCWYHPKVGLWIGATPERFINLDRNVLQTVALAGTIDATQHSKPNWTPKEVKEQQMVTDFIVNSLKNYVEKVQIHGVENSRAGNLWHLKSKIKAKIQPGNLSKVIENLHPTSAVCGLPQSISRNFILEHEGYDREYYSGFLGELNMKTSINRRQKSLNQEQLAIKSIKTISDLYVNLRCMKVSKEHVEIFVGGGITEDSRPKAEYLETVAKSQTLLNII
jgi:isochorismate synthase